MGKLSPLGNCQRIARQIQRLFASLFVFEQLLDSLDLSKRHLAAMFDDWCNDQNRYSKVILSIDEHLSSSNKRIIDFQWSYYCGYYCHLGA